MVHQNHGMIDITRTHPAEANITCTIFSDSESRALVASSKIRIEGSFTMALAIAILCFCPPENNVPPLPT